MPSDSARDNRFDGRPQSSATVPPDFEFRSVLFDHAAPDLERQREPDFFSDLNLDQVTASIVSGLDEYDLLPFFHVPLRNVATINYRHEVLHDLENDAVSSSIEAFAGRMRTMRRHLVFVRELRHRYQRETWLLEAIAVYCEAVGKLSEQLAQAGLRSRGLRAFCEHLSRYAHSEEFAALVEETEQLKAELGGVHYTLNIYGDRIRVDRYEGESDYSAEIHGVFERFRQGAVKDYTARFNGGADMNHVELAVLELVAKLFPDVFARLEGYAQRHQGYLDETLAAFDREIQFYVAYLNYVARFERAGLSFCYPQVSEESKDLSASETFDLALADRLIGQEGSVVVCNDWQLDDPERIFVVSGPNQGGKTTFARTFGQLHYLASLGCPVPGKAAELFLPDRIFTHFEREEDLTQLSGKLEDDLLRVRQILEQATPASVVVMNESFTSTTLQDALLLGKDVLERITELGALCVYVTFVDELASLSDSIVSLTATVDPEDPAIRTYKVIRRPADGRAYAIAIAEKYRVTYEGIRERISS